MKWCVSFPEEQVLVVRPSLKAICFGDKAAAKLLSVLIEHCNHADSPCIRRTAQELLADLCGTMEYKTLREIAIPTLVALGYVEVKGNSYVLHRGNIMHALERGEGTTVDRVVWGILQKNIEKKIIKQNLRRAEKEKLPATLTVHQWRATVDHFNGKCAYCREEPYRVLEHFIPLSAGGGTTYNNCIPACQRCNILKVMGGICEVNHIQQYLATCESEVAE